MSSYGSAKRKAMSANMRLDPVHCMICGEPCEVVSTEYLPNEYEVVSDCCGASAVALHRDDLEEALEIFKETGVFIKEHIKERL